MKIFGALLMLAAMMLSGCGKSTEKQEAPAPAPAQVPAPEPAKTSVGETEVKAGDSAIKEVDGQQVIKAGDIELKLPKD